MAGAGKQSNEAKGVYGMLLLNVLQERVTPATEGDLLLEYTGLLDIWDAAKRADLLQSVIRQLDRLFSSTDTEYNYVSGVESTADHLSANQCPPKSTRILVKSLPKNLNLKRC